MSYLLNFSLACKSSIGGASKEKYGCSGGLSEEIFGGGFSSSGVMVLGYEGNNG